MVPELSRRFAKTGIRPVSVELDGPWYIIKLEQLDCAQMMALSVWIKQNFYKSGKFSHLLPKLGYRDRSMVLVISKDQVEELFS